jgi:hypothetical protein
MCAHALPATPWLLTLDTLIPPMAQVFEKFTMKLQDDLKSDVTIGSGPEGGMLIERVLAIGKDGAEIKIGIVRV